MGLIGGRGFGGRMGGFKTLPRIWETPPQIPVCDPPLPPPQCGDPPPPFELYGNKGLWVEMALWV